MTTGGDVHSVADDLNSTSDAGLEDVKQTMSVRFRMIALVEKLKGPFKLFKILPLRKACHKDVSFFIFRYEKVSGNYRRKDCGKESVHRKIETSNRCEEGSAGVEASASSTVSNQFGLEGLLSRYRTIS